MGNDMKTTILLMVGLIALTGTGCLSFDPLFTPADTESETDSKPEPKTISCADINGSDLLIVVDNSKSMQEEQVMLSTAIYGIVKQFLDILWSDEGESLGNFAELRVALVSADMGLQYGGEGEVSDTSIATCSKRGDDGVFQHKVPKEIVLNSGMIGCKRNDQLRGCPTDRWQCENDMCMAPDGGVSDTVTCRDIDGEFTELQPFNPTLLANNIACMSQLGTNGCGVGQPLQASVRALEKDDQKPFIVDSHKLVIFIVSDGEDCSIEDSGLFETPEWLDPREQGTACHLPEKNGETYLFKPSHYYDALMAVKNNVIGAASLVAAVGVPLTPECEGYGDDIDGCLFHPQMEYKKEAAVAPSSSRLRSACTREVDGTVITEAAPGRRFVEAIQAFGPDGFIFSICNETWTDAMNDVFFIIGACPQLS